MSGWVVREQYARPETEHLCPDCGEEAVYVMVRSPQKEYMVAMMCPACNSAFPIVLQVER